MKGPIAEWVLHPFDISILRERLALGPKNDDTFGPNFQYPIKFAPKSNHVFGSNDHVFGTNLRQSIIFGPNTVNLSYCTFYLGPGFLP